MFNNIIEDNVVYNYQQVVLYFKMKDDNKILSRATRYRSSSQKNNLFSERCITLTKKKIQEYRDQMDNIVKFYQAEKYEEEGIIFEIDADQKANEIYQQVSKALASKGLMIDKVDLQKMNLWDMNNN